MIPKIGASTDTTVRSRHGSCRNADGPRPEPGAVGAAFEDQAPAASFRAWARSVASQVKSSSVRPKCPYAAVWA